MKMSYVVDTHQHPSTWRCVMLLIRINIPEYEDVLCCWYTSTSQHMKMSYVLGCAGVGTKPSRLVIYISRCNFSTQNDFSGKQDHRILYGMSDRPVFYTYIRCTLFCSPWRLCRNYILTLSAVCVHSRVFCMGANQSWPLNYRAEKVMWILSSK